MIPLPGMTEPAKAKPFLKWAGGKTQLLKQMSAYFPPELASREIDRYIEPFVGSGAAFFFVIQRFASVKEAFLFDLNEELVLAYNTIRLHVEGVIQVLAELQEEYRRGDIEEQKELFHKTRTKFNEKLPRINFDRFEDDWIERSAQIIFLNRTCFNGLFRVNAKGEFNVPFGRYKNPRICDAGNLRAVSEVLRKAKIQHGDFKKCKRSVRPKTFIYFDPPYLPISATSSFTSYSKYEFGKKDQERLAEFYREIDKPGVKLMLSNSDPKSNNGEEHFFEKLYRGYRIKRVQANRMINCDATKRGKINELLIMNY